MKVIENKKIIDVLAKLFLFGSYAFLFVLFLIYLNIINDGGMTIGTLLVLPVLSTFSLIGFYLGKKRSLVATVVVWTPFVGGLFALLMVIRAFLMLAGYDI